MVARRVDDLEADDAVSSAIGWARGAGYSVGGCGGETVAFKPNAQAPEIEAERLLSVEAAALLSGTWRYVVRRTEGSTVGVMLSATYM